MKKHLIIGNPVTHSLSPKIHNHWFNVNNIKGIYEKYSPRKNEIKNIIKKIKKKRNLWNERNCSVQTRYFTLFGF